MTSKRQSECDHDRLAIKPGGILECSKCGEEVDTRDLFDIDEPVMLAHTEDGFSITPLTHKLGGPRLS